MENVNISIDNLAEGKVKEQFNIEFEKILRNLQDTNTDSNKKRKLILELNFTTDPERELLMCEVKSKIKLVQPEGIVTKFLMGKDLEGNVAASEYKKQIPGQAYMKVDTKEDEAVEEKENESSDNVTPMKGYRVL